MKEIPRPSITHLFEEAGGRVFRETRGWARATCPLHEDKDPSARVNEDLGKWNCFVCNKGGDEIEFIKEWQGVGFAEAVRLAEKHVGDGHGTVRGSDNAGTDLVPKRQGHRQGRRNWVPPWTGM